MEVIKKGYIKRIKKCRYCKTKFIYDFSKLSWIDVINCPVCGEMLFKSVFDKIYKEKKKKIWKKN